MDSLWLSAGLVPLVRRQGLHRQGVDLFAHAVAQRRVDQLVALDAALAGERARHDQRLEVLPIAGHLDVLARNPGLDTRLDAFRSHHLSLYPDRRSSTQSNDTKKKLA